ncbi:MAG: hypothetical protein ACKPHU_00695 [Planctomycetaceae bacterium]
MVSGPSGEPRTGVRGWGPLCSSGFPARDLCFCVWNAWRSPLRGWEAVLSHAKPRSREAAKKGAKGRWAFFEYEYEYRFTEYEYEGILGVLLFFGFFVLVLSSPWRTVLVLVLDFTRTFREFTFRRSVFGVRCSAGEGAGGGFFRWGTGL